MLFRLHFTKNLQHLKGFMNWFNALFHKFYTWKVSFPHEVIEYALCVSCGSLKRFPHTFTTYRLPFCKKKSSQSSHLKAPFSHELIQFGFEVLFDWKATLARSHNVYIRKASFPHELFKLTFCEKTFLKKSTTSERIKPHYEYNLKPEPAR